MTVNRSGNETFSQFIAEHPQPGDDPIERLRHTVEVYSAEYDDEWVLIATSGVYGPGIRTGITRGDLRALLQRLGG